MEGVLLDFILIHNAKKIVLINFEDSAFVFLLHNVSSYLLIAAIANSQVS